MTAEIIELCCAECGHVWKGRYDVKRCPKCGSEKWNG